MNSRGFTLIELVLTIVIIGLGVAAFAQLMNTSTINSVDPMVRQQANAVARAYLEEILLKSFCDPDVTTNCPLDCNAGSTCSSAACTNSVGETRATFDDVCDYEGLPDNIVRDQTGANIGLTNYEVTVTVFDDANADLGGLSGTARQSLRVDVNVTHTTNPNVDVTVTGYKANY